MDIYSIDMHTYINYNTVGYFSHLRTYINIIYESLICVLMHF